MASGALRRAATRALTILGVVALVGGATLSRVYRPLFDSDAFADRIEESLSDTRVSDYLAEEITDAVLREKPDLSAVHPVLRSAAVAVVSSDAFRSIVHVTARRVHATVMSKGGNDLLLSVPDIDVILRGALESASPTVAARIPQRMSTVIGRLGGSPARRFILDLWEAGRSLSRAARLGVLVGLLSMLLGIVLAPRRVDALRRVSLDLVMAGVLLLLLLPVGRSLTSTIPTAPLARQAVAGLFDTFARGIGRLGLGFAGVGLVLSAAVQSLSRRAWPGEAARAAGAWLAHPPSSAFQRFLRVALFLAAGLGTLFNPSTALTAVALAAGATVAFIGLQELFGLVLYALPEERPAAGARGLWPRLVIIALAAAVALAIIWLARPSEPVVAKLSRGCNGEERLCDARLDEVVFAGTHNSMGSVDAPDFMFPQQERSLAGQLEDGVRAFLIDVYAGVPVSGRVKTELSGESVPLRKIETELGPDGMQGVSIQWLSWKSEPAVPPRCTAQES